MPSRMFAAVVPAAAVVALLCVAASPASADGTLRSSCSSGAGYSDCAVTFRSALGTSGATRLRTPAAEREAAESAKREALWTARCRPTLHYDGYGVGRYRYVAPGCEFGRYE